MSEQKGPWEREGNPAYIAERALKAAQEAVRSGDWQRKYELFVRDVDEFSALMRAYVGSGFKIDGILDAEPVYARVRKALDSDKEGHLRRIYMEKRLGTDATLGALEWEKIERMFPRNFDMALAAAAEEGRKRH